MVTFRFLFVSLLAFLWVDTGCTSPKNETFISPEEYDALKTRIKEKREEYHAAYTAAGEKQRDSLVKSAEAFLLKTITEEIIPQWYNTPWEFYGTTETPQKGTIACGYFVTTVIRDAGFIIPRVKWAQLASETFMKKLNPSLVRYSNVPIDTIEAYFSRAKEGIYLVGLDSHVGFVVKKGNTTRFIHSSYYRPEIGVMQEELRGRNPLNDSKYRVFARLLHREMVLNWIKKQAYS